MKTNVYFLLVLPLLLLFSAVAIAQGDTIVVPDPIGPNANLQNFLDLYAGLEGAVIVVLGYLHNWIPGINMVKSKWLRIVLIGAVVVVMFTALGWQQGFGQVFIFLQAVGFFEIVLKKAGATSPSVTHINFKKVAA